MLHNNTNTFFGGLLMYFLQPADDLKHNIMVTINDLALLFLTHAHSHFLEQLSK